jgi:hypothetical protein
MVNWFQVAGGTGGGTCPTPPPATPQVLPTYSFDGLLYALEEGGTFQEVLYLAGRPVAQRDSATGELLFLTCTRPIRCQHGGAQVVGAVWGGLRETGAAGVF